MPEEVAFSGGPSQRPLRNSVPTFARPAWRARAMYLGHLFVFSYIRNQVVHFGMLAKYPASNTGRAPTADAAVVTPRPA